MKLSIVLSLVLVLASSCSVTLSTVDYDDLYFIERQRYVAPTWNYYRPYWNPYIYSPFYHHQVPNIIVKPNQAPIQREPIRPGVSGGRSGVQQPQLRRGTRAN
jgi:hypothetical protein